jgi:ribosomal protein S18 acetylase RimI-like enzyme
MEIRRIETEFEECAQVIRTSFGTVAKEFGITRENTPTNPAFAGANSLLKMKEKGVQLFGVFEDGACIGFVAIEKASDDVYYMERLAVLPEHRHNGTGRKLMDFVSDYVRKNNGKKVSIAIINDNRVLKDWYMKYGFVETGIKTFKHLPFDVCFMEIGV